MRVDRVKLITEMARQDVTNIDLERVTGLSKFTISGIRRGASCRYETVSAIASALGVSVEALLENEAAG